MNPIIKLMKLIVIILIKKKFLSQHFILHLQAKIYYKLNNIIKTHLQSMLVLINQLIKTNNPIKITKLAFYLILVKEKIKILNKTLKKYLNSRKKFQIHSDCKKYLIKLILIRNSLVLCLCLLVII